jgi:hypothetical protein
MTIILRDQHHLIVVQYELVAELDKPLITNSIHCRTEEGSE